MPKTKKQVKKAVADRAEALAQREESPQAKATRARQTSLVAKSSTKTVDQVTVQNTNAKGWYFIPYYKGNDGYWHGQTSDGSSVRYRDEDHNWVAWTEPARTVRCYKYVIQAKAAPAWHQTSNRVIGKQPVETGEYFPDEQACIKSWAAVGVDVKVLKRLDNNFIDVEQTA